MDRITQRGPHGTRSITEQASDLARPMHEPVFDASGRLLGHARATLDLSNAPHRPRPRPAPARHELVMLHTLGAFTPDAPRIFETYETDVDFLQVESCRDCPARVIVLPGSPPGGFCRGLLQQHSATCPSMRRVLRETGGAE